LLTNIALLKKFTFREWLANFLEDAANVANEQYEDMFAEPDLLDPLDPDFDPTDVIDDADLIDGRRIEDMTDEELWDEAMGGMVETVLIIGLTVMLGILLLWRRQREEARIRERERQRQDQGGAAREEDRGVFPDAQDPDFMNWAVGGVGH
jgi:SEL1 protein